MSENIRLRLYRSELQARKDILEAWQAEHKDAMIAQDVEDIVSACLDDPARLHRLTESMIAKLRDGTLDDLNEARAELLNMFEIQLTLLEQARVLVRVIANRGHRISGTTELEQAIESVERQKNGLFQHWGQIRPTEADEGRAAFARGEYLELDEAFARIAGVDKETWQKRVEAHEKARQP